MPERDPSFVEDLLERCILALEAGDETSVEALLAQHPDEAPKLRQRIDQLASLGILQAPSPPPIPEQLGDFRLGRQLGRGGMGIVYLAEQTSLQRDVALKLVHPEQRFFQGTRDRFRREVLAIARLRHPGIVPVLTCGEAEGIPFYAMELVHGASLAEVLLELAGTAPAALDGTGVRTALQRALVGKQDTTTIADAPVFHGAWPNVCCRIALDVAEALQHAHENGVVHRDVKPSNLLLCVSGRTRVTDFGLASVEGEARITRSGAAFGSLPYMAPEQVRGDIAAIDARTDVYALGVTLYELLTLTLPHGDGSGTTRERILAGNPQPPTRRNALVHADLEAICLLAMDLDPRRRYPTAAGFADDLRAFLENRSVRARRPGWLLRTRRWAGRHPARAATLAGALLTLGPVPLGFAVQQSRHAARLQEALEETQEQRAQADAQRAAAEHNLDLALSAVDQMLFRTATGPLARHPRTIKLRQSLIEDALAFYERMASAAPSQQDQLRVQLARAHAGARVGRLHMELGDLANAEKRLEQAVLVFTGAPPEVQAEAKIRRELAMTLCRLGEALGRMNRFEAAVTSQQRALPLLAALCAEFPDDLELADASAHARMALATMYSRLLRFADAHAELDAVLQELKRRPAVDLAESADYDPRLAMVFAVDMRGTVYAQAGESQLARQSFEAALTEVQALPALLQQNDQARLRRLGLLERLGMICLQRREWDDGASHLDAAVTELEARTAEEPEVISWRSRLADVLGSRASNLRHQNLQEPAMADHHRAISLLEQAVAQAPEELHHRRRLAIAHAERANCYASQKQTADAHSDFETAAGLFEMLLQQKPDDALSKANFAAVLANHARSLASAGELPAARAKIERAIAIAETNRGGEAERSLIEFMGLAADLSMQAFDTDAGRRWTQQASERAAAWLAARPEDPLRLSTAARIESNRGTMHLQLREHREAIAVWERALPTARAAAKATPFGRQVLAIILLRLADVSMREHDLEAARAWFLAARTETSVEKPMVAGYAPLAALFDHEDLQDLIEQTKAAGK